MAGASGSVIELSNYLEKRLSQKSADYAAVSKLFSPSEFSFSCFAFLVSMSSLASRFIY
jgi:hypothetical protein